MMIRRLPALIGIGALLRGLSLTSTGGTPLAHTWQSIDGRSWQVVDAPESVLVAPLDDAARGACAGGMIEVRGQMLGGGLDAVEEAQKLACTIWIDKSFPERCATFDRAEWLRISAGFPRRFMRFCIDRFEYPNRGGEYPIVSVTWHEARAWCARDGKRLCTEAEWTFACEGEEATPYPNGYQRDAEACVIDRPWLQVNEHALLARQSPAALREMDRLWQGEPSGAHPRCRSPFGVEDMIGNVDEWTSSIHPNERPSILKGGYWGPVRTRCRPSPRAPGEDSSFSQQGFRFCADVPEVRRP